jgi:hypothetical protein
LRFCAEVKRRFKMDDLKKPTFWVLVVLTVLIAIVAVGNWRLYPRVETLEKKSRITGNAAIAAKIIAITAQPRNLE